MIFQILTVQGKRVKKKKYTSCIKFSNFSLSKTISLLINQFFIKYTLQHSSLLPDKLYQQYLVNIFDKSDWRNSTLPDIHQQLMTTLIQLCQLIDQTDLAKKISRTILQLEMRPDTWRKLQFDHISFFSNINW